MDAYPSGIPVEFIKGTLDLTTDKLYWISDENPPKSQSSAYFFNVDKVNLPSNNL
jgi:hypothetical protein